MDIKRRKVFYIPGFDPFPPRRYRELYRTESQIQAAISGYSIEQGSLQTDGFGWSVHADIDGKTTDTEIEVLMWADIVKSSMSNSILSTYLNLIKTAWIYISSGVLFDLFKLRKGPVIAALYPVGFLIGQLVIALLIAWGFAEIFGVIHPLASYAGLLAIWPILAWFKKMDGKVFAYYLMQDYAHSAQHWGAYPADLSARLDMFADKIATALESEFDEVLIVGHSSGAHMGVSILAELDRNGILARARPIIGFLSLGQVVPMVGFLPKATQLRQDLRDLSQSSHLTWVDVTAPGDGCAFALCDPVAVCGVAPEGKINPLVISAAFSQTLKPETWAKLKRRFFRLHFQYLCAFDNPGDYDYFKITAGAQTLKDRFAARAPSQSRIDHAVSRHRSLS